MKNRLLMNKWATFTWFLLSVYCIPNFMYGQAAFTLVYPGPDTLLVGANCTTTLDGNLGIPIITPLTPGANVTVSEFDPTTSGFPLNQVFGPTTNAITVSWKIEDDQGNTQVIPFDVYVFDRTAPVFMPASLANDTLYFASITQVTPPPTVTWMDNCTLTENIVVHPMVETTRPDTCLAGTFTRTWSATDDYNNTGYVTQTIIIAEDSDPPVATGFPQTAFGPCELSGASYFNWLDTQIAAFTATDPSGPITYGNNAPTTFADTACMGETHVTFTAMDQCGFSTFHIATWSSADNQVPQAIQEAVDTIVQCDSNGDYIAKLADWLHHRGYSVVEDACSPNDSLVWTMEINGIVLDSAQIQQAFADDFNSGCQFRTIGGIVVSKVRSIVEVSFFATDPCGNIGFAGKAAFAAIDTLGPEYMLPTAAQTEQCGGGNDNTALQTWINSYGNLTIVEQCSDITWENFSWTTMTGQTGTGNFGMGPYPNVPTNDCDWFVDITFKAKDACENKSKQLVRWSIIDTIKPVFTSPVLPTDTIYCQDPLPSSPNSAITDNCDMNPVLGSSVSVISTPCDGSPRYLLTWTATDKCGNVGTATQIIHVFDTLGPVISQIPTDISLSCSNFVLPAPAVLGVDIFAMDACGTIDTVLTSVQNNQDPDPNVCAHYSYSINRTFTVIDGCGNMTTAMQTIQIEDLQGPDFQGFIDTTVTCQAVDTLPNPSALDACGSFATVPTLLNSVVTAGSCPDTYTLTRTWQSSDICGNTANFIQTVHASDTLKPTLSGIPLDVMVDCTEIPDIPVVGVDIIALDNCDEDVTVVFNETENRVADPLDCAHYNYEIKREWIATDNCSNITIHTQIITVEDTKAPEIICTNDVLVPTILGSCEASVFLPSPVSLLDECTANAQLAQLNASKAIQNTSGQPSNTSAVDTLYFDLAAPNFAPNESASSLASLRVRLTNADAEKDMERFAVYGENGDLLGFSAYTTAQCGDSDTTFLITKAKINTWLADGTVSIILVPTGIGTGAINAICQGGGQATLDISYTYAQQILPVQLEYSLNGAALTAYPPNAPIDMGPGINSVEYIATDCSGNSSTCSFSVEVRDEEPPTISAPIMATGFTTDSTCAGVLRLPYPTVLTDNCVFSEKYEVLKAAQDVVFFEDPNASFIPANLSVSFANTIPNATSNAYLSIRHLGDNAQNGEFFNILDENGVFISTTTKGSVANECRDFHESKIALSPSQINAWAKDGSIRFSLVANNDAGTYFDFISPCGPLDAAKKDGISKVEMTLSYAFADIHYVALNTTGDTLAQGALQGDSTTILLPAGNFNLSYHTQDGMGNNAASNFTAAVQDTVRPIARCKPMTVFVNADGTSPYTLDPTDLDNGSYDICSTIQFSASKTNFSCDLANSVVPVTLTVQDTSGNEATCTAQVRVETQALLPGFSMGLCQFDTLQLFADPMNSASAVFTYAWTGPKGFISNMPDPILPNADTTFEGAYTVVATGLTGCTAVGIINVDITSLPQKPILTAADLDLCDGDDLILRTQTYFGSNVRYRWYSGTTVTPIYLGETINPELFIASPDTGSFSYYVHVTANGCSSQPSDLLNITVGTRPTASVIQSSIDICAGENLALGTSEQGVQITYQWAGPNGFNSTNQFPSVNQNVAVVDSGLYRLIVYNNGCPSDPVFTHVAIRPKPATPGLTANSPVCEGTSLNLISSIPTAAQYGWISPNFDTLLTTVNALVLPSVSALDSGMWRTFVVKNGCRSDFSVAKQVLVAPVPVLQAESVNSPVCNGIPIQLTASTHLTGVDFTWQGLGGINFASFNQNPTFNGPAGSYQVIAETASGCKDTAVVVVNRVPNPVVSAVSNSAPTCANGTSDATLSAVVIPLSGTYSYAWTSSGSFSSTDANPVLPNVDENDNGTYTVIVTDQNGCVSNPQSTVVNVQDLPLTPLLTSPTALCEGDVVVFDVKNANQYAGANISYTWSTPVLGTTQTTQPSLTINNVSNTFNTGAYSVLVTIDQCQSDTSADAYLTVHPTPPTPVLQSNSPVCAGDVLQLSTAPVPGAVWSWSGAGGFSASVNSPTIQQVDTTASGNYFLTYSVNGCESAPSAPLFVEIKKKPAVPIPLNGGAICVDAMGAVLDLNVSQNSASNGAQYTWMLSPSLDTVALPTFNLNTQINDFQDYVEGTYQFVAIAHLDGCNSNISNPTTVAMNGVPDQLATAGTDFFTCDQSPIQLSATAPDIGSGRWKIIDGLGLTISNPTSAMTPVLNGTAGGNYSFCWSLSNGACKDYSTDTITVQVVAFEQAEAIDKIDTCFAEMVLLSATQNSLETGVWSQPLSQQLLNVAIEDKTDPNSAIIGLQPGNIYYFYWTLPDLGCGISVDTVIVRSIGSTTEAGTNEMLCNDDGCHLLSASPLAGLETGEWTSPNAALSFASPNNPMSTVCGLEPGQNILVWTTNEGVCGHLSQDSIVLTYEFTPIPQADTVYVPSGARINFDVSQNDNLPTLYSYDLMAEPNSGSITDLLDGNFQYQPNIGFQGVDLMSYRVCNENCMDACAVTTVTFLVAAPSDCAVNNVLTPNGDGTNDTFFVPCIGTDQFPDNALTIFNEYGDEVFHAAPYSNNWDGTYNGENLPAGTYFYVIKFNADFGVRSGFLVLHR